MDVETIVKDVKTRADVVVTRGQDAFEAGVETIKAANAIIIDGVQTLVQTNVAAGKELVELAQASLEKARADGIKAVASNPVAYLPEGKGTVVNAYTDSLSTVSKTGDQLAKTLKSGYGSITAKLNGKTVKAKATKTAKAAKKTVRKAATRARRAATSA